MQPSQFIQAWNQQFISLACGFGANWQSVSHPKDTWTCGQEKVGIEPLCLLCPWPFKINHEVKNKCNPGYCSSASQVTVHQNTYIFLLVPLQFIMEMLCGLLYLKDLSVVFSSLSHPVSLLR